MLKITVESFDGIESMVVGEMTITNNLTNENRPDSGNYTIDLGGKCAGRVNDHVRSRGIWPLVARAAVQMEEVQRMRDIARAVGRGGV